MQAKRMQAKQYRRIAEPVAAKYGAVIAGQWEFEHEGKWFPVRNRDIRVRLDAGTKEGSK